MGRLSAKIHKYNELVSQNHTSEYPTLNHVYIIAMAKSTNTVNNNVRFESIQAGANSFMYLRYVYSESSNTQIPIDYPTVVKTASIEVFH